MDVGRQQVGPRAPESLTGAPPRLGHPESASAPLGQRPDPNRRAELAPDGLWGRLTAGGDDGNERLTALIGTVLIVLLAVIGVTILSLHTTLLWVHLFVGLLLIGPVTLKLASTGYRFARYYTHNPVYRRKGPPPPYLRALAPLVVLSTIVVFASGVALLLSGPGSRGALLPVHKISFIVWVAVTAVHLLGHLPEVAQLLSGGRGRSEQRSAVLAEVAGFAERFGGRPLDPWRPIGRRAGGVYGPQRRNLRAGRAGQALALVGALAAGLVLALLLIPEFGAWLHYHRVILNH